MRTQQDADADVATSADAMPSTDGAASAASANDAPSADGASSGRGAAIVEVGGQHGQRLDNFLLATLKGVPRSRVYRMMRRGEVRVNGARAKAGQRLARGDAVRIPPHRGGAERAGADAPRAAYEALRARILHEDADMLVLDKPSGHAVHGGSGLSFGVIETLRRFDPATPYQLAHRLDRDTSGCLIVARNRAALVELHAAFRNGAVAKRYEAIVGGQWPRSLRRVELPLMRYALPNGERRVRATPDGDRARTDFEVLGRCAPATWIAAFPKTGRTHQIRVHAQASGHPILGDDKYAGAQWAAPRLMLHAKAIKLTFRERPLRFEAPLPQAFERFVRQAPA